MKFTKKILSVVLSVIMIISVIPMTNVFAVDIIASGTCGANDDNLTWTLDSEGVMTISGEGDMQDYPYFSYIYENECEYVYECRDMIESVVLESGVTSIGAGAFYDCSNLTSVTIPDGVTRIGCEAFKACYNLTSITIPDSVMEIGFWAFDGCNGLTRVVLPDNKEMNISSDAFRGINLDIVTDIYFPLDEFQFCQIFDVFNYYYDLRLIPETLTIHWLLGDERHKFCQDERIEPTCTTFGWDICHCYYCGLESEEKNNIMTPFGHWDDDGDGFCDRCSVKICDQHEVERVGVKEATCLETGYTGDEICSVCGEYISLGSTTSATGHITETRNFKAATCTEEGYSGEKVCTVCEETIATGEVIAAKGHTETVDAPVAPTCTETGLTEGKHCSTCGEIFTAQDVIAAKGHTYSEWETLREPTCNSAGEQRRQCTTCWTYEYRVIDPTGLHNYTEWETLWEPTCNSTGRQQRQCTICWTYEYRETEQLTHIFGEWNIDDEATCHQYGQRDRKCELCGMTEWETYILEHIDEDGDKRCDLCGDWLHDFSGNKCGDDLTWSLDENGTLTISGTGDMWDFSEGMTPWLSFNPYREGRENNDPEEFTKIKKVIVEDGVTSIGDFALFFNFGLRQVILPESIKRIGNEAFAVCLRLEDINLPNSLETIGEFAFGFDDLLDNIVIPENVTYIGEGAFAGVLAESFTIESRNVELADGAIGYLVYKIAEDKADIDKKEIVELFADFLVKVITVGVADEMEFYESYIDLDFEGGFSENVIIKGYKNSTAEAYAKETGISFVALDSDGHSHDMIHIVEAATCVSDGYEYDVCSICLETFNFVFLPKKEHAFGEWTVTKEATHLSDGEKERVCIRCGQVEVMPIEKLPGVVATDEETGVSVVYNEGSYSGEVTVNVTAVYDGSSFDLINVLKPEQKKQLFDITTVVNDSAEQPTAPVLVMIPIPEGFNPETTVVLYVTDTDAERVVSFIEDGYICFYVSHFSNYCIVDESVPDSPEDPSANCTCSCHKTGISNFFWKILNFFHKLFGMEKYRHCACGKTHW